MIKSILKIFTLNTDLIMKKTYFGTFLLLAFLVFPNVNAGADEEVTNQVYIKSSDQGLYYAKSIPDEEYGLKGKTEVYKVSVDKDVILETYDWYSPDVYISDIFGSVVCIGPDPRGQKARAEHIAFAFYSKGKLLKKYSTLDIVGHPDNVVWSKSHYKAYHEIKGYRHIMNQEYAFDVKLLDHKILSFDILTGEILDQKKERDRKEILKKVQLLKSKWWYENEEHLDNPNSFIFTEEDLRRFSRKEFPEIPHGYRLILGRIWDPVRLERVE